MVAATSYTSNQRGSALDYGPIEFHRTLLIWPKCGPAHSGIQRVTKAKVFRIKHRWCQRDSYIFEPYNTSNQTNISMIEESHTKDLSSSSNNNQFHTYIQALQHFLIPIPLLKRI